MILRKEKRKRKHNLEEEDTPDKYVAYVRKTSKKNTDKNKKTSSCTVSNDSTGNLSEERLKKKKKVGTNIETTDIGTIVNKNLQVPKGVSISAKPRINKVAVELNAAMKANDNKILIKSKKSKSSHQTSDVPIVHLSFLKNNKSNFKSPVIVEANLKKSTNSYIPETLQDNKEVTIIYEEKPPKPVKSVKTKSETTITTVELFPDSDKLLATEQDPLSDIPKALQEFYNELTKGFEDVANKSSKAHKKRKKKSTLTVDQSVKDSNSLMQIVQKNTVENSSLPMIQGNAAQFFSLENKVILILCPKTQFSFLGKLKLRVLYGAVELYGSEFDKQNTTKPVKVYSPRGYSSISISTYKLDNAYDKEFLWDMLTTEGVDRSIKTKLHEGIKECEPGWTVLLLENFENALTNFLSCHSQLKLFPKIENVKYPWYDLRRAECILQANFQFSNLENEISICPQWNESIIKQLLVQWNSTKSLCVMLVGGKGVGKSTSCRYLINNLLSHSKKIVLLDLDPGQAEMTAAACVSLNIIDTPLLGPNFTHLKTPFYQLYLEDINVVNCITRYFECIKKIVECYKSRKELAQYPVVVNTMGFCKGIGLDICIFLIKLIEPSNVIQILSKRPKNNFDFALLKQTVNERKTSSIHSFEDDNAIFEKTCNYELHYIPSMAEGKRKFETWNMEPRQQRELVLLAYLSQIIRNADDKLFCNFTSNSINNIIPYKLPFSSFYVSLMKSSISPTHVLAAMNGNIVALCGIDLDDDTPPEVKESLTYPMVVIKPPACTCYGYGIVRGIDMKRRCVYLNTPLSSSMLQHVNLLSGCTATPFALMHTAEHANAPYAADRGELPTSREARRGYFRVEQNKSSA